MDLSIIPECYIDTNLVETIVPPQSRYNHQKGCGTVTKVMKEKFKNQFALGVIDRDKKEVDYLKEFNVLAEKNALILHKHRERAHYIIQIVPAIEKFIINCTDESGLNLMSFGLPNDFEQFKKLSKTVNTKDDKRFKKLFKELEKKNCQGIVLLSITISYLLKNSYSTDIQKLTEIWR